MEVADEGIERVVDSKDLQQQSKALDKLTDHVEDRQLDSTRVQEVFCFYFYFYFLVNFASVIRFVVGKMCEWKTKNKV